MVTAWECVFPGRRRTRSGSGDTSSGPFSTQYLVNVTLRRDAVPSFEQYPFSIPAIHNLDSLPLHPKVTFFVGENGSGKSTLLEGIAVAIGLNPEGGSRNFNFSTHDSHSVLEEYLMVRRGIAQTRDSFFLRAESLYNVASEIERLDQRPGLGLMQSYGGRSLHEQSHGESFIALILHRFGGAGGICLTSLRPRCHPCDRCRSSLPSTGLCKRTRSSSSPRIRPSSWPTPTPGSISSAITPRGEPIHGHGALSDHARVPAAHGSDAGGAARGSAG